RAGDASIERTDIDAAPRRPQIWGEQNIDPLPGACRLGGLSASLLESSAKEDSGDHEVSQDRHDPFVAGEQIGNEHGGDPPFIHALGLARSRARAKSPKSQ